MRPAWRHGAVESCLLISRLSVLAVELAFAVNVDVTPGLDVLVGLNAAGLAFPLELHGIFRLKGLTDGRVVPFDLGWRVNALCR